MWRSFYQGMDYANLPLFTLVLFIALFVAVLIRLFVFHRKEELDALAAMPLDDAPSPLPSRQP